MKKATLCALLIFPFMGMSQVVKEKVVMGSSYANELFYNFSEGLKLDNPRSAWDLAFTNSSMSASILINDGNGVSLYFLSDNASDWSVVDTTGNMGNPIYNSDSTWEIGAFNALSKGTFDYGWGDYDRNTHNVSGKSIFALVMNDGSVKKIFVEYMKANGDVQFKVANLDGSDENSYSFNKKDITLGNFAYFSFSSGKFVDLEPANGTWDILFTKYMTEVSMGPTSTFYPVTGVKHASHIEVAQRENVSVDDDDFSGLTFESNISAIGSDWKSFNRSVFQYEIPENRTYFVKNTNTKEVWKLYFTNFEGSSTGTIEFNKKLVKTSSISDISNSIFTVFPNPNHGKLSILHDFGKAQNLRLELLDMQGKLVWNSSYIAKPGFNETQINMSAPAGMYHLIISSENGVQNTKLVVE